MKRSTILNILKIAFAATVIWYVIHKAGWEKIRSAIADMDSGLWAAGLGCILVGNTLSMLRWSILMRSVGLRLTTWDALRLGFIGVFFNNVAPGLTGGDLVKAFYVARESPGMRADAVVTVIVDRIIGIVALALIAAVVIPFDLETFGQAALGIYGFLAVAMLGGVVVLSRRIKLRLKAILPNRESDGQGLLTKIDRAVSIYRHRLGLIVLALGMSVVVHMCIIVGVMFFGAGIAQGGLAISGPGAAETATVAAETLDSLHHLKELGLDVYCSVVPIIMIISALPIAPAGWGVGEAAFVYFFATVGISDAHATALSFVFRITSMLVSLIGGVFLVFDRRRVLEMQASASESPAEGV